MSCGQPPAGPLSVGVAEPLERGKVVAALREPGRVTVFEFLAVKCPSVLVGPVLQGLHGAVLRLQERSVLPVALGREIHPLAAADRHREHVVKVHHSHVLDLHEIEAVLHATVFALEGGERRKIVVTADGKYDAHVLAGVRLTDPCATKELQRVRGQIVDVRLVSRQPCRTPGPRPCNLL